MSEGIGRLDGWFRLQVFLDSFDPSKEMLIEETIDLVQDQVFNVGQSESRGGLDVVHESSRGTDKDIDSGRVSALLDPVWSILKSH